MTTPEVVRCFDDYFRRVIYSLAIYIADYPEQTLVTCIVQGWCPRYGIFLFLPNGTSLTSLQMYCAERNFDEVGGRRCREHTELLVSALQLGEL
jgi:hypothetical protein